VDWTAVETGCSDLYFIAVFFLSRQQILRVRRGMLQNLRKNTGLSQLTSPNCLVIFFASISRASRIVGLSM
jgi:hypothetical protein